MPRVGSEDKWICFPTVVGFLSPTPTPLARQGPSRTLAFQGQAGLPAPTLCH
jgi:hypothetical protein